MVQGQQMLMLDTIIVPITFKVNVSGYKILCFWPIYKSIKILMSIKIVTIRYVYYYTLYYVPGN